MLIVIVCLVALLVIVQVVRLVVQLLEAERKTPAIDQYVGHTVVLHLAGDGPSLRGVLVDVARDSLTLARAEYLTNGPVMPLDGRQVVDRARVEWHQVLYEQAPARADAPVRAVA